MDHSIDHCTVRGVAHQCDKVQTGEIARAQSALGLVEMLTRRFTS
jgi:hypothetical protein